MPKNLPSKEKTKKRKIANEGDIIERSRLPNPNNPSIHIDSIFDAHLHVPVKNEVLYPDTRFERSTTLFPAKGVIKERLPSEASSEAFKRCAEKESSPTLSKKIKTSGSSETINSIPDDCMIIENLQKEVKIEIIDLTDDSDPIVPELSSEKIGCLKRTPGKSNTILQANSDVHIKVELSENTYEINANAVGATDTNYCDIQEKSKQNKAGDGKNETSNHNSSFNISKNTPLKLQLKIENSLPSESINEVNKDYLTIEPHLGSHFRIKSEKDNLRENNTEAHSEKNGVTVSQDANCKTSNINFRFEPNKENEGNREINSQVRVSNDICDAKLSTDFATSVHQFNDVSVKIEQNENCTVNENSTSLANLFSEAKSTGIISVDRPIKSERNKNNENCEVRNGYTKSDSAAVSHTELETEHRSMFTNEKQTYKKADEISMYSVNTKEVQENVVCDKNMETLIVAHLRNKAEKYFQKSCEKPQSYDGVSQENTETKIQDELNQKNIYPSTDSVAFSENSQLCNIGTFRKPLLKYLNCNMKVDIFEISQALSTLNAIKDKDEITVDCNVIKSEAIPNSTNSQDKLEFNLIEKREELSNREINDEKSLEVDETLDSISSSAKVKQFLNSPANATNLAPKSVSPNLEKSIKDSLMQNPLNNNDFGDEIEQNNSFNAFFECTSKKNEPNLVDESDSQANFNSPVNIGNLLEENYPSTNSLSSLVCNKRCETSNDQLMKLTEQPNKKLLSNDCLRQILSIANSRGKSDISDISPSMKTADQKIYASKIIDEGQSQSLRQIKFTEIKTVGNRISSPDVNEYNSEEAVKNAENFSKLLRVSNKNVFKEGIFLNQFIRYDDTSGTSPKRVKMSEDASTSKSSNAKKFSYRKYKKKSCNETDPHYSPDRLIGKYLATDYLSNLSDSSSSSNLDQNMLTPPGNIQIHNLPVSSDTSSHNPGNHLKISENCSKNTELADNCSSMLHKDVNCQKQLNSFNINQAYPLRNAPEIMKSFIHPHIKQLPTVSLTNETRNSVCVPSSTKSFLFPVIGMEIQQVNKMLSENNSFIPSNCDQRNVEKNSLLLPSGSESSSSFTIQNNLHQSVQDVKDLSSLPYFCGNALYPSQSHNLLAQEISPMMSSPSALTNNYSFSETVHHEFINKPPLPANSPPPLPPLPPKSPNEEVFNSIASSCSQSSLVDNHKKLKTVKRIPSEFAFTSLLPKQLNQDIGKNIIHTNDVYLIIIERNIDWIHGIDKKPGDELFEVQNSYTNHLMYYNTYFPLLLLECFSKISTILKVSKREKTDKKICKIVHSETKQSYVSFTCDSFIRHSEVENIPKDGHIIFVKFGTVPTGGVKMLGYVCSSATRAYSHRHDHSHEILKYMNATNRTELLKIKINFYIVFNISGINLNLPIEISKLTSIKKVLLLNDALKELQRSPLCNAVLNPRNNNCKYFTLPHRQDVNTMVTVVQGIVQSFSSLSSQMVVIESAPFTDSLLAIVLVIEEIQKTKIPGKILVCVRLEMLNHMGMNLVEPFSNFIIINRERENINKKLQNNVLDVLASQLSTSQNISEEVAKSKVLQEADVYLVVIGTCFYEDVQCVAKNLEFCIIHDAHSFTEPESLLPLLYGIRRLLLFGYHEEQCNVSSKRASSLGYNKSLFHRAYNLS